MGFGKWINAFALASGFLSLADATSPPDLSVRTHNAPGLSVEDTHLAIRRGLAEARFQKRDELKGNTTLDRSWDGAVLLKFGLEQKIETDNDNATAKATQSVEIVCTKCYIKGFATAELKIPDDFDAADALNGTVSEVGDEIKNFTESVQDYIADYFTDLPDKFEDGIDFHDFALPPMNYSFDMDVPAIPECTLDFTFDDMELYLELNTIIGAGLTYELNLYTSNTPIGIGVGKDLKLGVVFKVDLILSVEGSIDISSGLHIKLDDGVAIDIALFGEEVSNIVFNGGQFEFLPVTVESAGVVMKAVLRIGIHSGISVVSPSGPSFTIFNQDFSIPTVGSGIEVGIFANLAEFTTNVTVAPDDDDCKFKVVQEYQMALGAKAGASIAFDSETWGPIAETSIPIWNTALASICAGTRSTPAAASATPTITAKPDKRQDLETVTTTTKVTHTGVQCISSMVGNCPASLLSTTQSTETKTLTTAVPSGQDPTFPPESSDTVTSTADFGSNALSFTKTSGSPTSYTPPPPTSTSGDDSVIDKAKDKGDEAINKAVKALEGDIGGVSKKLILAICLGVGGALIIGIIVAVVCVRRRRRYNALPDSYPEQSRPLVAQPYGQEGRFEPLRPADQAANPRVSITVHNQ